MARIVKQLSDTEIKKIKAKEKDFKISDGKGLYLVIKKNGTKFFRFDFTFGEKRKSMSFGIYPSISLKEARNKRDEAKELILKNVNPINQKKLEKKHEIVTLEFVTKKWLESISQRLSPTTIYNYRGTLTKNVLKELGKIEIKNIKRIDIVNLLAKMNKNKHSSSLKRIYKLLSRIYSFAVVHYNLDYNPVDFNIIDIIPKNEVTNYIAITKKEDIKALIRRIHKLNVDEKDYFHYSAVYAIKILPYVFTRISSFIKTEWEHIDLDKNTWFVPAANTKTNKDFLYPIPVQVKKLLEELKEHTLIKSKYVFNNAQNRAEHHLSRATVGRYLKEELGFKGEMTLHGFRSTFSTTAYEHEEEHGYSSFIIEACLSHSDKNKIRSAYNRESLNKYFEQKKALFQWYANWLNEV